MVGCGGGDIPPVDVEPQQVPTETLRPRELRLEGTVVAASEGAEIASRRVVLCELQPNEDDNGVLTCFPGSEAVTTEEDGSFEFEEVQPGQYIALVDSGLAPFDVGHQQWQGETLRLGDWQWLKENYYGSPEWINVPMPGVSGVQPPRASYAVHALLAEGSPFIAAHSFSVENVPLPEGFDNRRNRQNDDDNNGNQFQNGFEFSSVQRQVVTPIVFEVGGRDRVPLEIPVVSVEPFNREAIRQEVGALNASDVLVLDQQVIDRWNLFMGGDDSAFYDMDMVTIRRLRSNEIYRIENTRITPVEERDGELVKAPGYSATDIQTGARIIVGWWDAPTGDVIETATLYRLNVRDHTGVTTQPATNGQRLYRYGFTYYRPWGRIFPDPIADMIANFYTAGAQNVQNNFTAYGTAAGTFGGDMRLIEWDQDTDDLIRSWRPNPDVPPFILLPDSGTVDIRRERFGEAVADGQVRVEQDSIRRFLNGYIMDGMTYANRPEAYPNLQETVNALLHPYYNPQHFNDMESAIILAATYSREEPLVIYADERLDSGFRVPLRSENNEVRVADWEVGWVILAYPGALSSRWAHEMGHVLDFNSEQYTFRGRPQGGSRCEPLKYMIEYMWWVERYPGDAPAWDWMPINSGLALARLLTDTYHNSGC